MNFAGKLGGAGATRTWCDAQLDVIKGVAEHFGLCDARGVEGAVVRVGGHLRHGHHIEDGAAGDLAKDGVLAVQVCALVEGDEELRAIVIRPGIGHGHNTAVREAQSAVELVLTRGDATRVRCGEGEG